MHHRTSLDNRLVGILYRVELYGLGTFAKEVGGVDSLGEFIIALRFKDFWRCDDADIAN